MPSMHYRVEQLETQAAQMSKRIDSLEEGLEKFTAAEETLDEYVKRMDEEGESAKPAEA